MVTQTLTKKKKWSHKQKIDSPWISPLAMDLD